MLLLSAHICTHYLMERLIQHQGYGGKLQFAQFFVKPLMSQDVVLREINVIDYEHKKNLLSDGWRMYQRAEARQRSAWATVLPTAEYSSDLKYRVVHFTPGLSVFVVFLIQAS
ncbi:hypothetical protein GUJ93_ZPchr0014g47623 [Zizania palustris]|uniref:Uncharacterized protein n=1 Tax=Zizania palustris TaxID=103762 RepID=A0A8J5TB30_ZIZPA|nr:hypothetical protein GUJ93_ZPchr0014g47623 [Zizania palustris]